MKFLRKLLLGDIYSRLETLENTQDEQDDVLIEMSKLLFGIEETQDEQDDALIEISKTVFGEV